jgi:hypothetical protein
LAPQLKAAATIEKNFKTAEVVDSWQQALVESSSVRKSLSTLEFLRDQALSEQVRFRAAQDLLDRAAIDLRKQTPQKTVVNLFSDASTEELMEMLRRLGENKENPTPLLRDIRPL